MSKYLYLSFKDARLFSNESSKDRVFDFNSGSETDSRANNNIVYEDIINYKLLSNVLRVLCGIAPKASFRETLFPSINRYDEIAKESYVFFGIQKDGNYYELPKNRDVYFKETKTQLKSHYQSFNKVQTNWYIAENFLKEAYEPFIKLSKELNVYSYDFLVFLKNVRTLNDNDKNAIYTLLNMYGKKAFYRVIYDEKYFGLCNDLSRSVNGLYYTIGRGIENVINLSGIILVPYSTDLNIVKTTCNIFDGGLVQIDKIDYVYEDQLDMFTKVSNYSTKTKKLIKKQKEKDETED